MRASSEQRSSSSGSCDSSTGQASSVGATDPRRRRTLVHAAAPVPRSRWGFYDLDALCGAVRHGGNGHGNRDGHGDGDADRHHDLGDGDGDPTDFAVPEFHHGRYSADDDLDFRGFRPGHKFGLFIAFFFGVYVSLLPSGVTSVVGWAGLVGLGWFGVRAVRGGPSGRPRHVPRGGAVADRVPAGGTLRGQLGTGVTR